MKQASYAQLNAMLNKFNVADIEDAGMGTV